MVWKSTWTRFAFSQVQNPSFQSYKSSSRIGNAKEASKPLGLSLSLRPPWNQLLISHNRSRGLSLAKNVSLCSSSVALPLSSSAFFLSALRRGTWPRRTTKQPPLWSSCQTTAGSPWASPSPSPWSEPFSLAGWRSTCCSSVLSPSSPMFLSWRCRISTWLCVSPLLWWPLWSSGFVSLGNFQKHRVSGMWGF